MLTPYTAQKLSIESGLTNAQKKSVVKALLEGKIEFDKHPKSQSEESYTLMRKFALILLRDITKGRDSLVHKEFAPFLQEGDEAKIKANFEEKSTKPDDDINVSVDQTENLTTAIAKGMHYPVLDANGNVSYQGFFIGKIKKSAIDCIIDYGLSWCARRDLNPHARNEH